MGSCHTEVRTRGSESAQVVADYITSPAPPLGKNYLELALFDRFGAFLRGRCGDGEPPPGQTWKDYPRGVRRSFIP